MALATHLRELDWTDQRVLELGTGCGLLAGVMADGGAEVVALDVSKAAVECARANLADSDVDVRHGDLFDPVAGEQFDLVVTNPPYEIGRSFRPRYRSPDFLERVAADWRTFAPSLLLAFPTDSTDVLESVGFDSIELTTRLPTKGRELGVFQDL